VSQTDDLLGPAPASFDAVQSGFVRLRRNFAQSGSDPNAIDAARLKLLDSLIRWLTPTVEHEAARWDAQDREAQLSRWA